MHLTTVVQYNEVARDASQPRPFPLFQVPHPKVMALDLVMAVDWLPHAKYEPLPRFRHISGRVGSKLVVQGGRTKDFSEKRASEKQLSSVVEIFDPYSELWEQRQVQGVAPSPGTYGAASASLHDGLFSFGGYGWQTRFFNTLHRLDSKTWRWSQVSPQNADGAPMPKYGCGMMAFRNSLVVFGGYGVPRGPTEPGSSFIKHIAAVDGQWMD